jgi:hypothetical protein
MYIRPVVLIAKFNKTTLRLVYKDIVGYFLEEYIEKKLPHCYSTFLHLSVFFGVFILFQSTYIYIEKTKIWQKKIINFILKKQGYFSIKGIIALFNYCLKEKSRVRIIT